jgi:sporulation protein YlmC with PRC-barrel domain
MADSLLFLTELMGMKVYDLKGRKIGRLRDACLVPSIDPVLVDRYLVGGELTWWTVRQDQIERISLDGIFLRDEQLIPYHEDEYTLRMVRDLLDQQIIDIHGRKVVRVNDVTMELRPDGTHDQLWVREVDVGVRSIFRRLCQGIVPPRLVRRLMTRIPPNSIRWEFCNIVEPDPQRRLRLKIDMTALEDIHPADLADIVEELSHEDREAVFEAIDSEVAADTLSEVEDPRTQASILESLEADRAADILEEMDPDEAADVLAELEDEKSEAILDEMEAEPKGEVEELLEFDERSAGGMMTSDFFAAAESGTVADAMAAVREQIEHIDALTNLFLVDADGRLTGSLPVGRLLLAESLTLLKSLAIDEEIVSVVVTERRDRVTEMVDKYNLMALPVVDDRGVLVGAITADDIISVLRQE